MTSLQPIEPLMFDDGTTVGYDVDGIPVPSYSDEIETWRGEVMTRAASTAAGVVRTVNATADIVNDSDASVELVPALDQLTFVSIAVAAQQVAINFDLPPTLLGDVLIPANWHIEDGSGYVVDVTNVSVVGNGIVLATTEMSTALYTMTIPSGYIVSSDGVYWPGSFVRTFSGVGVAPTVSLAASVDPYHAKVIFSEPVKEADALVFGNYSIPGLIVSGASKVTDRIYVLTTSAQTPGASYTVTVSNIHDLAGNLI